MIRSISWKHNQMGKAKKMTERPFAGLTIIWKAFNTILWPIMVAITSMFFACKQTPKIETLESTQRFKSLSELKIPLCVSCRSTKEVQAFEDSLGSRRIDLVLGHIAKAFNQTAFEAADTLKNYTSEYGGYANFSNQYDYEIYIRKQTNCRGFAAASVLSCKPTIRPIRMIRRIAFSLMTKRISAPRIDYCLGWASSYGHYSHVDGVGFVGYFIVHERLQRIRSLYTPPCKKGRRVRQQA
jgi:hypothetical protein